MYKDLLPGGSVVQLNGVESKVMICGRIAVEETSDEIYDYVGCVYPFGITAEDNLIFFDRDLIERVYFIGYQDEEELSYRNDFLDQLGELKVENGEIVPVEAEEQQ